VAAHIRSSFRWCSGFRCGRFSTRTKSRRRTADSHRLKGHDNSRLAGSIDDNPISGFGGHTGVRDCGIFIAAGATKVDLGENTFPAPGNDVDVCDDRLRTESTAVTLSVGSTP
jgi:hypothetical protein